MTIVASHWVTFEPFWDARRVVVVALHQGKPGQHMSQLTILESPVIHPVWHWNFAISYSFQMQSGIWNNSFCFLAGNFFPASYTLLGYFEVTWQLTMKLFPAKIFEGATPQKLWCQSITVLCYPRMLTDDDRYSKVSWISSYNKSLKDRSLGKQLIMLPSNLNVSELWDSQETKLTVSFRTSH